MSKDKREGQSESADTLASKQVMTTTAAPTARLNPLDELILAFEIPKTLLAFRKLADTERSKFQYFGLTDSTPIKDYKPDAIRKAVMDTMKIVIESENKDDFRFNSGKIPSILEQKIVDRYTQQGVQLTQKLFQSKVTPICEAMLQHVATANQMIKAGERVAHLAQANDIPITEIQENPSKGVNPSFTAMVGGRKHYIKTCSDDAVLASAGKVDPNELLVYKVMEYMSFGPRTNFLFGRYSSAAGKSSISRGNYIMTEDLNQDGNRLLLDTEENYVAFQEAMTDQKFAVELSAASALNDILSLTDTFGRNTRNYGLLVRPDGGKTIQFVDHLPNANNGLFSLMSFDPTQYSPREALQKRSSQLRPEEHSAFKDLSSSRSAFQKIIIEKEVKDRLFGLDEAVQRASTDVARLMERYNENFVEGSDARMGSYLEKIARNKVTYEKTLGQQQQEEAGK
jgi:hypothetical protein